MTTSIDDLRNLADAVRRAAQVRPDAPALVRPAVDGRPRELVTWRDLDRRVDGVAAALQGLDLSGSSLVANGTAPRIALALSNVPEFATSLFAVLRAGFVAVPINPTFTAREVNHQLADSGAAVLIADDAVLERITETPRYSYPLSALPHVDGAPPATSVGGEDLAVLLYTSGTAGAPRGAMLSHRALIANHRQVDQVRPPVVTPDDVVLLGLPLFHAFGLNTGLGAIAWHGACGVLLDHFDPAESLRIIAEERVTVLAAVPQMYAAWSRQPDLRDQLTSVRVAISGAAPLGAMAAHRFFGVSGHRLVEGYGLTETAPVVATALASPTPKDGSIGRPVPGVSIRLVDGSGAQLAELTSDGLVGVALDDFDDDAGGVPGTDPGEIVVRGDNLFSGYWPDGLGGPGPDGWWPTGDVAYADADGDLFLVDRLGELIIVSGFNVYPHEVELVLAEHPGVREAAVVGIPSAQTGEAVKAYVVPADGGVTVDELRVHCEANLARFKCPVDIEIVAELAHSATGKVRKGALRGRS